MLRAILGKVLFLAQLSSNGHIQALLYVSTFIPSAPFLTLPIGEVAGGCGTNDKRGESSLKLSCLERKVTILNSGEDETLRI